MCVFEKSVLDTRRVLWMSNNALQVRGEVLRSSVHNAKRVQRELGPRRDICRELGSEDGEKRDYGRVPPMVLYTRASNQRRLRAGPLMSSVRGREPGVGDDAARSANARWAIT